MIDDRQRREVAIRLRKNLKAMRIRKDWYRSDSNVVECGNAAYRNIAGSVEKLGNMIEGNYLHIVELLADLIDRPMCKPAIPNEMEGCVFCPQCGAEIGEYGVPNYCYNCGMEIRND